MAISNHLGFIDSKLWLKVQDKLSNNKQISIHNAGKYSWLTGLMKCSKCGYAIKVNYSKPEQKLYLICSGKSNLKVCDAHLKVDLRELENAVEQELIRVIRECNFEEESYIDVETTSLMLEMEQKIERLVSALAESSSVSATYISKEIERLHKERERLAVSENRKGTRMTNIEFSKMAFEEKKFVAAQFIDRVLLSESSVEIIWKI